MQAAEVRQRVERVPGVGEARARFGLESIAPGDLELDVDAVSQRRELGVVRCDDDARVREHFRALEIARFHGGARALQVGGGETWIGEQPVVAIERAECREQLADAGAVALRKQLPLLEQRLETGDGLLERGLSFLVEHLAHGEHGGGVRIEAFEHLELMAGVVVIVASPHRIEDGGAAAFVVADDGGARGLVLAHLSLKRFREGTHEVEPLANAVAVSLGDVACDRVHGPAVTQDGLALALGIERADAIEPVGDVLKTALLEHGDDRLVLLLAQIVGHLEVTEGGDEHDRRRARGDGGEAPIVLALNLLDEAIHRGCAPVLIETERAGERFVLALGELGDGLGHETRLGRLRRAQLVVGMLAGEELVGHDAERVDVVARIRRHALEHLDGRIGRRDGAELSGIE